MLDFMDLHVVAFAPRPPNRRSNFNNLWKQRIENMLELFSGAIAEYTATHDNLIYMCGNALLDKT